MYNDIILNGLPIIVSGENVVIYDALQNTSHYEAEKLLGYLHAEGFIGDFVKYSIIRDYD